MGRHQPWSVWFADLYLMGLNGSNRQMAEESNLNESDGQAMAEALRGGIVQRRPPVRMGGVVECDEVYVVAGHKGRPDRIGRNQSSAGVAMAGRMGVGSPCLPEADAGRMKVTNSFTRGTHRC